MRPYTSLKWNLCAQILRCHPFSQKRRLSKPRDSVKLDFMTLAIYMKNLELRLKKSNDTHHFILRSTGWSDAYLLLCLAFPVGADTFCRFSYLYINTNIRENVDLRRGTERKKLSSWYKMHTDPSKAVIPMKKGYSKHVIRFREDVSVLITRSCFSFIICCLQQKTEVKTTPRVMGRCPNIHIQWPKPHPGSWADIQIFMSSDQNPMTKFYTETKLM